MISNCWKGIRPIKRALPSASGSPAGRRKAARLFCLSLFCLALPFLAAAQGILPQHKTLANGLDIVVLPIPSTDRISLSLVFRGGAEGQNSKTAGYPRLVERVLFRGSVSNPGEPEPAGAMEALAPLSTTGGTDRDRFSLGFSVAPEILGQGLDTLALLFSELRRESAFSDPAALKEAKSASLAEIARKSDDPSTIYESALSKKLFSTAPWRLDPLGSPTLVQAVSADDLKAYATAWLGPNNAVLILAGALDPEAAFQAADAAFSSWKKPADPWKTPPAAFPKPGVTRPTLLVYPDPTVPKGEATVEMRYRAPDSLSSRSAQTDLWAELAGRTGSRLLKAINAGMPGWSSPSSTTIEYEASRFASWISVLTKIALSAKGNPADAAMTFKEIVRGSEMYALKASSSYFGAKDLEAGKASLKQRKDEAFSEPETAVLWCSDGWIRGGFAWIDSWEGRLDAVTGKDLSAFADEYFMKNLEIIALRLSPDEYAARKKNIDSYGFTAISSAKAFWWQ